MRALVIGKDMPRLVATELLSALTPRAFVGPLAPIQLREISAPALPASDWAVARTRLCGLCGSDYKQVFMTCYAQGEHGAVKVLFDRFEDKESSR